jgi:hypothetical protein
LESRILEVRKDITFATAKDKITAAESKYKGSIIGKNEIADVFGGSLRLLGINHYENFHRENGISFSVSLRKSDDQLKQDAKKVKDGILALVDKAKGAPVVLLHIISPILKSDDVFWYQSEILPELLNVDYFDNKVSVLNINDALTGNERVAYKFKSDFHLTTAGEFLTAKLLANKLNELGINVDTKVGSTNIFDLANYDIIEKPFLGNATRSLGHYWVGVDNFEMYVPKFDTAYEMADHDGNVIREGTYADVLMNGAEFKADTDEYTYWITNYMQYPKAHYEITNILRGRSRILFIGDSMTMRTITFLSLGVNHIAVCDTRQNNGTEILNELLKQQWDAIVFAPGISANMVNGLSGK